MKRLAQTAKLDRPREKFLQKGPDALSNSDLLAILLSSGVKGQDALKVSRQIINRFKGNLLEATYDELLSVVGIGQAKALQILSAFALAKRYLCEEEDGRLVVADSKDVVNLTSDLRTLKKEHLVCLYLNARRNLLKKETISVGLVDKTLVHPREIFQPAIEICASSVILVHNHPSGQPSPSKADSEIVRRISSAGDILGVRLVDFVIVAKGGSYSFYQELSGSSEKIEYAADATQQELFNIDPLPPLEYTRVPESKQRTRTHRKRTEGFFSLQNRRYLGNKFRLLGFIEDIVSEKCGTVNTFCDIFAGTGVVGTRFNTNGTAVFSNDFLKSNYVCLRTFLGLSKGADKSTVELINHLNSIEAKQDNYFSKNFGGTFFTIENARKIGLVREEIDKISSNDDQRDFLLCSLVFAVDKVANTVGHYDAFRKKLDSRQALKLLIPDFDPSQNSRNKIFREDANKLIRTLSCDVLYIDPPYNSRQYSDAYHLLENLVEWEKPRVYGKVKKMDRSHIKSRYCLKDASAAFHDLVANADCRHILLSYNNTGETRDCRSNARITDDQIVQALSARGEVEVFEKDYKAFSAGKSSQNDNAERIFYCRIE